MEKERLSDWATDTYCSIFNTWTFAYSVRLLLYGSFCCVLTYKIFNKCKEIYTQNEIT